VFLILLLTFNVLTALSGYELLPWLLLAMLAYRMFVDCKMTVKKFVSITCLHRCCVSIFD
jgi:hypothetical protein